MDLQIMVSVYCLAYNQEKYIAQTLDGFVMQKTNFKFEVIVHDDASIDKTPHIIREYADKYPDIIIPVIEEENQYSKNKNFIKTIIMPLIRGRYMAACEGDDYWCDENKLQKQVDWIETHPECVMVCHNTERVTDSGKHIDFMIVGCEDGYLDKSGFINKANKNPHFSSLLYRTDLRTNSWPSFFSLVTGDNALRLYASTIGEIYYINEVMSVYRIMVPGSWSWKQRKDSNFRIRHTEKMIMFLKEYDEYTNGLFHNAIESALNTKQLNLLVYKGDFIAAYNYSKKIGYSFLERLRLLKRTLVSCFQKLREDV